MARYHFTAEFEAHFKTVCHASISMGQAAQQLQMNYKTVVSHAKRLGCFKTNQPGRGMKKDYSGYRIPLSDIFEGKVKTFQSNKLKKRILEEGIKLSVCELCKLDQWNGVPIPLELHHIDGNRYNNSLQNLEILCPNCHALTDNFRARNIKNLSARLETSGVEPLKVGETFELVIPSQVPEKGKV